MDLVLEYSLYLVLYFAFVWLFFVIAVRSQTELEEKYGDNKIIMGLFNLFIGLPFVLADFVLNVVMTVPFSLAQLKRLGLVGSLKESFPDFGGARYHFPLFTHRLKQSILYDPLDSATLQFSVWVCRYMIEPHDFGHCSMYNLRARKDKAYKGISR